MLGIFCMICITACHRAGVTRGLNIRRLTYISTSHVYKEI